MHPDPGNSTFDKKAHECTVAKEVVRLALGAELPIDIESVDDLHPDVKYTKPNNSSIGIECTSYVETEDRKTSGIRSANQRVARNLTEKLNRAWFQATSQKEIRIVPGYSVGPESDKKFPSKHIWPDLISEIIQSCKEGTLKARQVWLGCIPREWSLVHQHLYSLKLADGPFASDNYITGRANLNEDTIVSTIKKKAVADFSNKWSERWLIIHEGRVADGGAVHEMIPSIRIAKEAAHNRAAVAAKESGFNRVFIYALPGCAELNFDSGGYNIFEYKA